MGKTIPLRKCIGCGNMVPKNQLVRVVRIDNTYRIDPTHKANGRGAYMCKTKDCCEQAKKRKGLERSFKSAISTEMYEALEQEIEGFEER